MKKDWEIKKLGEIALFRNGIAHEKEIEKNGKFIVVNSKFVSSNGAIRKYTNECLSPLFKDEIVFVMSDVPKGKTLAKCYIIEENNKYSLNQRICAFSDIKLDLKFFFYCLNRNKYFLSFDNGENQTNLRKNDILNCPFPVPPLEEQKRIVKILDEKFAQLETIKANAQTNLQNAKDLFQSQLTSVLLSNPNWNRNKLGDTVIVERGSSPRPIEQYLTKDESGVNWIKIGDTKNVDKVIYSTKEKITPEGAKKSRYVKKGDFILSNSMSLGKPYIMGIDGYIHDGWFVLRLPEDINTDYFFYLLSSNYVQEQFTGLAAGAIVKNISSDLVKKAILIIPPLPEQKCIVKELDTLSEKVRQLQEIYTKQIANCDELKQAYLQKAVEGEI